MVMRVISFQISGLARSCVHYYAIMDYMTEFELADSPAECLYRLPVLNTHSY